MGQPLTENLIHLSPATLQARLKDMGELPFRSTQILRWLWKEGVQNFDEMSNLSKGLREKLKERFYIQLPKIIHSQQSSDGTIKYLLELEDQKSVETVWIPRPDQGRVTVCVSSQVGCKMGCTFCLTAQQKVERNLKAGEIAAQLLVLPQREEISNVVVMGMGEPFDNYDELMGALDLMIAVEGLEIAPRRITVSTSGLVPALRRFVKESKCMLAVSLNAPNDEIRNQIMPINKAYNLEKLLGALRDVSRDPSLRARKDFAITFEYILIAGLNDQPQHAEELCQKVRGLPAKINLLLYNENPNVPYQRPSLEAVEAFRSVLMKRRILNFVRSSRGRDISAACGQLVSEHKRQQAPANASLS